MTEVHIDPSRANFDAFKALPRDRPIQMLNLLRYRELAAYPCDHSYAEKNWTGREAYAEYGRTSGPIFHRVGGRIVWRGTFETVVTGPEDMCWNDGFIAEYPSAAAFFAMINDEAYRQAVVNRTAALADSRLVRFAPAETGGQFAA